MTSSGVGLVLTPVGGPVHRGVDDVLGLVTEVEQAADLGQGQADPAAERRVRFGPGGADGLVGGVGGGVVRSAADPLFSRGVDGRERPGNSARSWPG